MAVLINPPKNCNVCEFPLNNIIYDARTRAGPWAYLCESCFRELGCGLGTGFGQKYAKERERFVKVEG